MYETLKKISLIIVGYSMLNPIVAQTIPNQGNPVDNVPQISPASPKEELSVNVQPKHTKMEQLLTQKVISKKINIQGVKTLDFKTVSHYFDGLYNKTITVGELLDACNKVTQLYKEKGYPLSFAFVPTQDFKNGVINIVIVEGYVSEVIIKGDAGASKNHILAIAQRLEQEKPLTQASFERVINILAMQPGMQISANIPPPASTDGHTQMELSVKHKSVSVGWGVQNVSAGVQGALTFTENSLSPLGEQLRITTLVPKGNYDKEYYAANYTQPIGSNGASLKVDALHYRGDPQNNPLLSLGYNARYDTDTKHIGAAISYPVILNNQRSLTLEAGMYMDDSHQKYIPYVQAPDLHIATNVRVAKLEANYIQKEEKGASVVALGLYKGINDIGASRENTNTNLDFFRTRLNVVQIHELPYKFGIKLSGVVQYSGQRLPSTEQISFGGTFYGAGYPSGEMSGDKGWGMSAEINRSFDINMKYLKTIQPYILTDNANVLSNSGELAIKHLQSVAIGVRVADKDHYTFDMSVAQPVGDKPVEQNSRKPQVNILYSYQLQ